MKLYGLPLSNIAFLAMQPPLYKEGEDLYAAVHKKDGSETIESFDRVNPKYKDKLFVLPSQLQREVNVGEPYVHVHAHFEPEKGYNILSLGSRSEMEPRVREFLKDDGPYGAEEWSIAKLIAADFIRDSELVDKFVAASNKTLEEEEINMVIDRWDYYPYQSAG